MHPVEQDVPAPNPLGDSEPEKISTEKVSTDRPWRRAVLSALPVWLAAILANLVVTASLWRTLKAAPPPLHELPAVWARWDALAYLNIATNGYTASHEPAWFPLYPLLVRGVDVLLPSGVLVAAATVSAICCLAALALLHRLTEHEFDSEVARRATFYLAAFPTAFFLFAAYNESLFVVLALAARSSSATPSGPGAGSTPGLASRCYTRSSTSRTGRCSASSPSGDSRSSARW